MAAETEETPPLVITPGEMGRPLKPGQSRPTPPPPAPTTPRPRRPAKE